MKTMIAAVTMLLVADAAAAQAGACLYSPAELSATLGHTPEAGEDSKDGLGMPLCRYRMTGARGRYFSVRVNTKCDAQRFESHARLMQSTSGKASKPLPGIGDGAYFSPGGTAAARAGGRCIELSGLRAGATKPVTEDAAAKLLSLGVSRAGN